MNSIINIFQKLNIKEEEYFLTGSRALDMDTCQFSKNNSDYDFVVLITNRYKIIQYCNDNKIEIDFSCYNGGFKIKLDGKIVNFITPIWIEFEAWRESLAILKLLINTNETYKTRIKNKMTRYLVYEQLRIFIKTLISLSEEKQ